MIFRLTHKASAKLRIPRGALGEGQSSLAEWYCNLITVRRQFFLFTHATTLFSFWALAAGAAADNFGRVFRSRATEAMRDYDFSDDDIAKIVDDGPDVLARATDRGVLGSMVDFAFMFRHVMDDAGTLEPLDRRAINDIANACPMGKIGMQYPKDQLRAVLLGQRKPEDRVLRLVRLPPGD